MYTYIQIAMPFPLAMFIKILRKRREPIKTDETMKRQIKTLAAKFDTDKNSHGYIDFYQNKLPDEIEALLELGAFEGESLLMWQAFYGKAKIHTIENFADTRCISQPELEKMGFIVHRGDQNDVRFLSTIRDEFNVIVDDGDHRPVGQIQAFRHLFANNLKSKGLYFIEDVYSNDEGWNEGVAMKDRVWPAFESFVETGNWGSRLFPPHEDQFWRDVIKKVEFYDNKLILIRKK
jgi:hypothetical protein